MNEWSCNVNDQGGYGDDAYVLVTDDETYGTPIARVCCYEPGTLKRLPYEANARLIAAAPALFTSAKNLLDDVRRRYPGEELKCPFMRALDEAVLSATPTERGDAT